MREIGFTEDIINDRNTFRDQTKNFRHQEFSRERNEE